MTLAGLQPAAGRGEFVRAVERLPGLLEQLAPALHAAIQFLGQLLALARVLDAAKIQPSGLKSPSLEMFGDAASRLLPVRGAIHVRAQLLEDLLAEALYVGPTPADRRELVEVGESIVETAGLPVQTGPRDQRFDEGVENLLRPRVLAEVGLQGGGVGLVDASLAEGFLGGVQSHK
jgi:hypothetical protein